jgi:hypothetical protein
MKVLDLFAGLGGWAEPFRERGHEVVTVDIEPRFDCTITADVLTLPDDMGEFDIICASPPCEAFSLLALGHYWLPGYVPKHEGTLLRMELVRKTVRIIEATQPAFWVIENPMGMLRKLNLIPYERRSVTYCQYGGAFRKETDLWGGFPPSMTFRPRCKNYDTCHISAPRGSRTGIQGNGVAKPHKALRKGSLELNKAAAREYYGTSNIRDLAALRAKIPHELALDVCLAAEHDRELGQRGSSYSGRLFT